jgi:hypothetical protein
MLKKTKKPDETKRPRQRYDPPEPSTTDAAFAVARAGAQMVPIVGGSAVELLAQVMAPPLQRRQQEWMNEVAEGLRAAEVNIADLGERQDLLDTLLQAGQAAARTSDTAKRRALRNAVINAATRLDIEADERHLFIQMVDRFTAAHLRFLKALQNPKMWAANHQVPYDPPYSSSLSEFFLAAFPEFADRRDIYSLVIGELSQAGLASSGGFSTMMTKTGWEARRTTDFGDRFLRFIEDPTST